MYASPERRLVFDLNDFDETLPGPFEYDVKRMAASFAIAGRNNEYSEADTRAATLASVIAYREAMTGFAGMRTVDIWYAQLPEDHLMAAVRATVAEMARAAKGKQGKKKAKAAEKAAQRGEKLAQKARTRDSLQALPKLGEVARLRLRSSGKEQVHAVLAKLGIPVTCSDLFGTWGSAWLDGLRLPQPYAGRCCCSRSPRCSGWCGRRCPTCSPCALATPS